VLECRSGKRWIGGFCHVCAFPLFELQCSAVAGWLGDFMIRNFDVLLAGSWAGRSYWVEIGGMVGEAFLSLQVCAFVVC